MKTKGDVHRSPPLTVVFIFLAVLMAGLIAETAEAQGWEESLRELELTDAVLLKGTRLVFDAGCPIQRARDLLDQAGAMQKEARGAHQRGQYRAAIKITRAAREQAQEAIKLAERWQFVEKQIHRIRELLDLAAEMVRDNQNPRAASLLETALNQFEWGKDALREGQVDQAFSLLKNANTLTREIIAMLQEEVVDRERVVRELDRTDRLIDKTKPMIEDSGDDKARALFDRGVDVQIEARRFFEQGRYRLTHRLTMRARELVAQALVMVEGPMSPERVSKDIAATDQLMERVRSIIMESLNQAAIDLFLSAEEHQDKAKVQFEAQRYKLALAQTKIARRLVDKALNLVGGM